MRRSEKEITQRADIEAIIRKARVCRLGLAAGGQPYVVPMCFGYRQKVLYLHGAHEGRKMEIIRQNPRVCFEFDLGVAIIKASSSCGWGMRYQSVIGFGRAEVLVDEEEKRQGLEIIFGQYSDRPAQFTEQAVKATTVIRVAVEEMTGKQSGL